MSLQGLMRALHAQPGYTLMRGVARFSSVRRAVWKLRAALHRERARRYRAQCEAEFGASLFPAVECDEFVGRLRRDGVATGLKLPPAVLAALRDYADGNPCFADRQTQLGFPPGQRCVADARLGKPILLAQYFNTEARCPAVGSLVRDPKLRWIAASYLGSVPTFVGANLWWTFAVKPLESDRDVHAHLFHRDVDDFRFFKFFFYLTQVEPGDGAHVCVRASHGAPPPVRGADRWNIRRYSDREIAAYFPPERILEICGGPGTGFAEDTLCVHKGLTPTREPRLLLQLQFALFDYGVMHDRRDPATLRMLC